MAKLSLVSILFRLSQLYLGVAELELLLGEEELDAEVFHPVVGQRLVECCILLLGLPGNVEDVEELADVLVLSGHAMLDDCF